MGRTLRFALVYGGIGGAVTIAVIAAGLAFELPRHFQSQWFGYLVMLVAMSLIFVGVKRYRDVELGGTIRFGRAFVVGLATAVVAGLVYVAGWEAYLAFSGEDFMADYSAAMLADLRASGASEAEISARAADMQWAIEAYEQPLFRVLITFSEIFPVGLLVALISALVLRNPRVLPARVE